MKNPFSLFFKKEETEKLKEIPIPNITKTVTKDLNLYGFIIQYNKAFSGIRKYRAVITYKEDTGNTFSGISKEDEILGKTWEELIANVSEYFENNGNS